MRDDRTMCTAAAAVVPGSVVAQVLNPDTDTKFIRNRTSGRSIGMWRGLPARENESVIEDTFGFRTANLLMEGIASIRR